MKTALHDDKIYIYKKIYWTHINEINALEAANCLLLQHLIFLKNLVI